MAFLYTIAHRTQYCITLPIYSLLEERNKRNEELFRNGGEVKLVRGVVRTLEVVRKFFVCQQKMTHGTFVDLP